MTEMPEIGINSSSSTRGLCFFLPSLNPGGAESSTVTLANLLAARGYPVDLVVCAAGGALQQSLADGVKVVTLNRRHTSTALFPLTRYLLSAKPFSVMSIMDHANVVAILAGLLSGRRVKVVASVRTAEVHSPGRKSSPTDLVLRWLTRLLYPFAATVHCVSKDLERTVAESCRLKPMKTSMIYASRDIERIRNLSHTAPGSAAMNQGRPYLLSVARLEREKDHACLLRAFALVAQVFEIDLLLAGEGKERANIEVLISELQLGNRVKLLGYVPNPYPLMRQANVFVLSSVNEGLPGALVEAIACGVPVVATDCETGPSEILSGGRWGRLVPVGEPRALAAEIIAQLREGTRPDASARAFDFDQHRNVARYIDLLTNPS